MLTIDSLTKFSLSLLPVIAGCFRSPTLSSLEFLNYAYC